MTRKPSPPFGYRQGAKRQEPDPLEQLVLRVTRETVAAGGSLHDVADALAAAVCFECGAPATDAVLVVPGGTRTVPLCGRCAHWRQPVRPGESDVEAFGRIARLGLSATETFEATILASFEFYRAEKAAEEAAERGEP